MPITSRYVLRWTSLLFAIGVMALIGILGATAWLISRTAQHADAVVSARETRAAIVDLKSLVQDAEIGQRGFLLTLKDSYLEPFELAKAEIPARLDALQERLQASDESLGQIAELRSRIDAKLQELSLTVSLAREGRSADALDVVDSGVGKQTMDEARALFDSLVGIADERLAESIAGQQRSAGALQWIQVIGAIVILLVAGGAAWIVMVYTRDLTSARTQIEQLNVGLEGKVLERTVELSRANAEIQRFAYIVTHDLRAPLVNIMGFTSELEASLTPINALVDKVEAEGGEADAAKESAREDLPEAIGFIRSSTQKMDGLINAILKLSRDGQRQLKPERIELEALLKLSADAVQHQIAEAGGTVELDVRAPSLVCDRISLEQITGNLIDNAVKYSSAERPLHIAIRARPAPANRVVIEIEDNGRGISEQDHERVFELFRRSGMQDKAGEGIGLAYVRSSVRNLGGDVTLKSELGRGTTFVIDLPGDLRAFLRSKSA